MIPLISKNTNFQSLRVDLDTPKIFSPVSRNEMGWLTVSQELWLVYINLKNIWLASHSKYTDQWHIWMNRTILTSELHSTSPRGYNFLSLWNYLQGSAELYYSWKRNTAVLLCNQLSDQKDYCTIIGIYVANEYLNFARTMLIVGQKLTILRLKLLEPRSNRRRRMHSNLLCI